MSILKLILERLGSEAIVWVKDWVVLQVSSISGREDFLQLVFGSLFLKAQKVLSSISSVYLALI